MATSNEPSLFDSNPSIQPGGEYAGVRFERATWTGLELEDCLFEDCVFVECAFDSLDARSLRLRRCRLERCTVTAPDLHGTRLNDVHFVDCRLSAMDFSGVGTAAFRVDFLSSRLMGCNFHRLKMVGMNWVDCDLSECDFGECELTGADFSGSRLAGTRFNQCNLEKADFATARDYSVNPAGNKLKDARFSLPDALSLLSYLGIKLV